MAESCDQIFEPEFVKIVDGIQGAEGPVFCSKKVFYMVAPEVEKEGKAAGQIVTVDVDSGVVCSFRARGDATGCKSTIICEPSVNEHGGIPAGCQGDHHGNLFVADMRLGLLKVSPDGTFQQIAKVDADGRTMQGCNDCAYDYDGNLWVTAPAGDIAPAAYTRSMEKPFGSVYCYTKDHQMVRVATDYRFPNGIGVKHSDDGKSKILIVAETPTKSLWAYDIVGPGQIENKRLWGTLPGHHEGGPDGMDFDIDNNLLVANWGSSHIEVFGSDGGKPIMRIKCPFARVSNVHFHPNSSVVYVTEHDNHALWKFTWKRNGKPQFCDS